MSSTPQLYLIDGMALLFRSFYAMGRAKMTTPDGTPSGAVYGFLRIMVKLMKDKNPSHFAVTWDRQEKTFRHEMFPEYKSHRSECPSDLVPQIQLIKELIPLFGIPSLSKAGFEGDDIIGTVATSFANHGDVYIVSGDKDFMQLVNDRIKIISLKTGDDYEVVGANHVKDYFGVPPEGVIDVLALKGDASDFVPGVKGIGEKSAAKLISEFGSLDNMYENIEKVTNKRVHDMLLNGKEQAYLSKRLVTIEKNVPLEFDESSLQFDFEKFATNPNVRTRLQELSMASLVRAIYGSEKSWPENVPAKAPAKAQPQGSLFDEENAVAENTDERPAEAPPKPAASWGERTYHHVRTRAELHAMAARMMSPDTHAFSFDTETTGLDIIEDKPIGFSASFAANEAYYVPAHANHNGAVDGLSAVEFPPEELWQVLNEAFAKRSAIAVAHNLKFDLHQLKNVGVDLGSGKIACSMVAAWCIDSVSGNYGLDAQTFKHFGLEKIPTSRLIGKAAGRSSMTEVPAKEIAEYGAEDADATFRLWEIFERQLREAGLDWLFWDLEMPVLRVLSDMERAGVYIDRTYLDDLSLQLQSRIMQVEQEVCQMAGTVFNIASPKQLGVILFETLKVHEKVGYKGKLARTTIGYKTDAAVLETFAEHPCVSLVLEHRELSKLLNTYVFVLPTLVKKSTNRIHTCFNQIGTATGRLSSTDPNLQNIPIRSEWGRKVRAAFSIEKPENIIIAADYSQIELRVLAHLTKDESMLAAFRSLRDIHRETAAKLQNKTPEEVTSEERSAAKAINFGIIYGMGAQRLAREQGVTVPQAKSFIEKYFLNFARIREYLDSQKQFAHQNGYVSTHFGRTRRIHGLKSANMGEVRAGENIAINSPIQGTAADIMKLGMLRTHKALRESGMQTRLLLQVHDELVLEGPLDEKDRVQALVQEALQGAVDFSIPLTVEVGAGKNWLEAK